MNKIEIGLLVTLILAIISGATFIGKLDGRLEALENDKDYSSISKEKKDAVASIKTTKDESIKEIDSSKDKTIIHLNKIAEEAKYLEPTVSENIIKINSLNDSINNLKQPKSCRWVGISNQSGGHSSATNGREWVGSCPSGYYAKSFKLFTWGDKATYHHSLECCAL